MTGGGGRRWSNGTVPSTPLLLSILLLGMTLLPIVHTGTIYGMYKPNRCYSCMSEWYEQFFRNGALSNVFYEPKNFTSACDEPARPDLLEAVSCRTICLTVQQEVIMMGHRTGQVVTMRGCAITLAKRGIQNHTLALFDRFDICREMSAAGLFRSDGPVDSQRIRVCSCLGDRCNGALTAGAASTTTLLCVFLALLFLFEHR